MRENVWVIPIAAVIFSYKTRGVHLSKVFYFVFILQKEEIRKNLASKMII